jgi:ribosomal protein S18 acetylase RimI-like enzyme
MTNFEIRKATLHDINALQALGRQTFSETFAAENAAEDMVKYLEESFSIEKLTAELNNPDSEFYVAVDHDTMIGYLKLNVGGSQTELKDNAALEIERIYVVKAFHGKKIGQLLYDKAIEVAKSKKVEYVWLGVWEENHRALNFYKKNGFVAFDKHIFKLGNDEQIDIMMKLQLTTI